MRVVYSLLYALLYLYSYFDWLLMIGRRFKTNPRSTISTIIHIFSLQVTFGESLNISKSKTRYKSDMILTEDELLAGCHLGTDSHADMSCIGSHAAILEVYEGQLCNVMPFNDTYTPMRDIKTVNAAFAYDSDDGKTYIFILCIIVLCGAIVVSNIFFPNKDRDKKNKEGKLKCSNVSIVDLEYSEDLLTP